MLSSSVVCLSFTTLHVFENKKGIIKILVYSSVIDNNQMDVIFFALIITSGFGRFAQGALRVLIRLLEISHKYGIRNLFTGKIQFWCCPGWGICTLFVSPTVGFLYESPVLYRGAFAAFPEQNDKCLTTAREGWVHLELTEP